MVFRFTPKFLPLSPFSLFLFPVDLCHWGMVLGDLGSCKVAFPWAWREFPSHTLGFFFILCCFWRLLLNSCIFGLTCKGNDGAVYESHCVWLCPWSAHLELHGSSSYSVCLIDVTHWALIWCQVLHWAVIKHTWLFNLSNSLQDTYESNLHMKK